MSLDDFFSSTSIDTPKNDEPVDIQNSFQITKNTWIEKHKHHGKHNALGSYLQPIYHSNPSAADKSEELSFLGCKGCNNAICCYCGIEMGTTEIKQHRGCRSR